jgi:hypothetical protein
VTPITLFSSAEPWGSFSDCEEHGLDCEEPYCDGRKFRYVLRYPTGLDNQRNALAVLANPSSATPDKLDPTITRWVNWCRDWGFGWAVVVNCRAWRATHPKSVPPDPRAIGDENDLFIREYAETCELVVCGWGKLGGVRGPVVLDLIRSAGKVPHALRQNKDGSPCHPLYLPASCKPFPLIEPKDGADGK